MKKEPKRGPQNKKTYIDAEDWKTYATPCYRKGDEVTFIDQFDAARRRRTARVVRGNLTRTTIEVRVAGGDFREVNVVCTKTACEPERETLEGFGSLEAAVRKEVGSHDIVAFYDPASWGRYPRHAAAAGREVVVAAACPKGLYKSVARYKRDECGWFKTGASIFDQDKTWDSIGVMIAQLSTME